MADTICGHGAISALRTFLGIVWPWTLTCDDFHFYKLSDVWQCASLLVLIMYAFSLSVFFLCGQIKADIIISVLRRRQLRWLTWPVTLTRPDWYFYKNTGIHFRARRQTHVITITILSVRLSVTLANHPLMVSCIKIHCAIYDKVRFLWFLGQISQFANEGVK